MTYNNPQAMLKQYSQVNVLGGAMDANPHRLVQMLLEGALDRIALAKGFMQRGDNAAKGEKIGLAITIIDALRGSLDHSAGGDIARNLDSLYDYMNRQLLAANLNNRESLLDEVTGLLLQIKSGWDRIEPARQQSAGGQSV